VVTAEEHNILGGLGEKHCKSISPEQSISAEFVAVNDSFGESHQLN
jgi:transketolase